MWNQSLLYLLSERPKQYNRVGVSQELLFFFAQDVVVTSTLVTSVYIYIILVTS